MVTVSEASSIISNHLFKPATILVRLRDATGMVLAEPVKTDRDFPPFHRVSMDGIAIRYEEWLRGRRTFPIEATQAAGEKQKKLSDASHCIEVMTGAMLPSGCDTVIRYEDLKIENARATVTTEIVTEGQSIH